MKIDKCGSCSLYKINDKQRCFLKNYFERHSSYLTTCPCMECLVKVTCHNVCSYRFAYSRRLLVEVEGKLLEQEANKNETI